MELDKALPDGDVLEHLRRLLFDEMQGQIDLGGSVGVVNVPNDAALVMVTKLFLKEYQDDLGFGAFRALTAVGEVVICSDGTVEPEFCFASLYYNRDAQLITVDFHTNWR